MKFPPLARMNARAAVTFHLPFGQPSRNFYAAPPTPQRLLPTEVSTPATPIVATLAVKGRDEAMTHFDLGLEFLRRHKAFNHPVFRQGWKAAAQKRMAAGEFAVFSEFMLAHLHIAGPLIGVQQGDTDAQDALNAVRVDVFDLAPLSQGECYLKLLGSLSEFDEFARKVDEVHARCEPIARLGFTLARDDVATSGVMSDIYRVCEGLREAMGEENFQLEVQDRFDRHVAIDTRGKVRESDHVDYVRGSIDLARDRQIGDLRCAIAGKAEADNVLSDLRSIAEAQDRFFSAMNSAMLDACSVAPAQPEPEQAPD